MLSTFNVAKSYLTLCDPLDCNLPGSSALQFLGKNIEVTPISGTLQTFSRDRTPRLLGLCVAGTFFYQYTTHHTAILLSEVM